MTKPIQMNSVKIRASVTKLLDKSEILKLSSLIHFGSNKTITYQAGMTKNSGLYAVWLYNRTGIAQGLNRTFAISGPNRKMKEIEWNWNLQNEQILLYVGKSTNIRQRIARHLRLGTEKWAKRSDNTLNKITSSCQVRAGLEHLIHNSEHNSFEFLNQFVGVSLVELSEFQDRFFAEDLAIGEGKPWFNVDSER